MFDRETRSGMSAIFWLGLTFLVLVVIAVFTFAVIRQPVSNLERTAIQGSNQYVQSKVTEIVDLKAQWDGIEVKIAEAEGNDTLITSYRAQEAGIIRQACQAYHLLTDKSVLDNGLRNWLSSHGCS